MQVADKAADKRAADLLKKYDKLRKELREVEDELEKAAIDYGHRRGHIGFTRVETMRLMMENEAKQRSDAA